MYVLCFHVLRIITKFDCWKVLKYLFPLPPNLTVITKFMVLSVQNYHRNAHDLKIKNKTKHLQFNTVSQRTFYFKLAVQTFKYNTGGKETVNTHLPQFYLWTAFSILCDMLQFLSISYIHGILKGSNVNFFSIENSSINVLKLL